MTERDPTLTFAIGMEGIIAKYSDVIGTQAEDLRAEMQVDTSKAIEELFAGWDAEKTDLRVGVVGRVKAGKSSLLNSLFFDGQSVLPKAATPMTAALTALTYGEDFSAEVEFFSDSDIADIRDGHSRYKREYDRTVTKKLAEARERAAANARPNSGTASVSATDGKMRQKAKRVADREMRKHPDRAAYEHYQRLDEAALLRGGQFADEGRTLAAGSVDELMEGLTSFVGSQGKYMPLTKCVTLRIPEEALKGVEVVDTPGINDPVQSREERTRELLRHCDVVFVVSPAGQFLTREDTELMDRLAGREGIQELFLVASHVDTQLLGSEKEENDGELDRVLSSIATKLGQQAHDVLGKLRKDNPEVGNCFDQLIEDGPERCFLNSGLCYSIAQEMEGGQPLDEGSAHVWRNLAKAYPCNFDEADTPGSCASLMRVANRDKLFGIICDIREKKEQIVRKRRFAALTQKEQMLRRFHAGLQQAASERIKKIEATDLEKLDKELRRLARVEKRGTADLTEQYHELIVGLGTRVRDGLWKTTEILFNRASDGVKEEDETTSKTIRGKKSGVIPWLARLLGCGGYESYTTEVTTVRTGAVREKLRMLTRELKSNAIRCYETVVQEWRKDLNRELLSVLRDACDDDELDIGAIRLSIGRVVRNTTSLEVKLASMPCTLKVRGTVEGTDADAFIEEAQEYIHKTYQAFENQVKRHCERLTGRLGKVDVAKSIFADYRENINKLQKSIQQKTVAIDRLKLFIEEVYSV